MQSSVVERRPLYGIGTVARLTGLKPDTLRVWERRYGLGASFKSDSGRRQYTQGDLEHLQLIAALVQGGSRIGEIANAGRKTLETLLRGAGAKPRDIPVSKPRVAFIGGQLCDWLSQHQGCLAGVDALLVRATPDSLDDALLDSLSDVDALVLFTAGLNGGLSQRVAQLREQLQVERVLVTHEYGSERAREQLEAQSVQTLSFPPEPGELAFELNRFAADKITSEGATDMGDLAQPRPREFGADELAAAAFLKSSLGCECPRHIAQLVESLANFEQYSADCSVDNWEDAAVHARVYAFTAQARWLMERAMKAALEGHEEEFKTALGRVGAEEPVEDVA